MLCIGISLVCLLLCLFVFFVFFVLYYLHYFFFFSSRRRHTRCLSDWSSDVCSSDLRKSEMGRRTLWLTAVLAVGIAAGVWTATFQRGHVDRNAKAGFTPALNAPSGRDRKSTRLNSSHLGISYAVFCLKKKNNKTTKA